MVDWRDFARDVPVNLYSRLLLQAAASKLTPLWA